MSQRTKQAQSLDELMDVLAHEIYFSHSKHLIQFHRKQILNKNPVYDMHGVVHADSTVSSGSAVQRAWRVCGPFCIPLINKAVDTHVQQSNRSLFHETFISFTPKGMSLVSILV